MHCDLDFAYANPVGGRPRIVVLFVERDFIEISHFFMMMRVDEDVVHFLLFKRRA